METFLLRNTSKDRKKHLIAVKSFFKKNKQKRLWISCCDCDWNYCQSSCTGMQIKLYRNAIKTSSKS